MFFSHFLQGDRPLELVQSDNFVGKVPAGPGLVPLVELGVSQAILNQWRIAGFPGVRGHGLADMGDAGMRGSPVEPESFHAGIDAIFSELIILSSLDDLVHVRVLHGQNDIAGYGAIGRSLFRARHPGGHTLSTT